MDGTRCDQCDGSPVVTHLDGEDLCQACADKWCKNEGDYAREREQP